MFHWVQKFKAERAFPRVSKTIISVVDEHIAKSIVTPRERYLADFRQTFEEILADPHAGLTEASDIVAEQRLHDFVSEYMEDFGCDVALPIEKEVWSLLMSRWGDIIRHSESGVKELTRHIKLQMEIKRVDIEGRALTIAEDLLEEAQRRTASAAK